MDFNPQDCCTLLTSGLLTPNTTYLSETVLFSAQLYATITSHVSSYAAEPTCKSQCIVHSTMLNKHQNNQAIVAVKGALSHHYFFRNS